MEVTQPLAPDQFTTLIDQCVAEVQRTSGTSRRFKPPANPMRFPVGRTRVPDRSLPDVPAAVDRRWSLRTRLVTILIGGGLIFGIGAWVHGAAAQPASPPPAPTSAPPASATPSSVALNAIRQGDSCHQIERILMSSFRNPDGTAYTQLQADAVLTANGASC